MEEDEELTITPHKPIKRNKNIIDDDEDGDDDNNNNNNNNDTAVNKVIKKRNSNSGGNKSNNSSFNDDINNSFNTPSPKIKKSRLRKAITSPSSPTLDISPLKNNTKKNKVITSPQSTLNSSFGGTPNSVGSNKSSSSPSSNNSKKQQQSSPSPYKPKPTSHITTRSKLIADITKVLVGEDNKNRNNKEGSGNETEDNPWDLKDDGTMTFSPSSSPKSDRSTNSSPSSSPSVNKKQVKISTRKVVARTIKDKDLMSFKGVSKLYNSLKLGGFSTKQSNKANLEKLFGIYSKWSKELNPAMTIEDSIVKVEILAKTRLVKNHIDDIKNGVVFDNQAQQQEQSQQKKEGDDKEDLISEGSNDQFDDYNFEDVNFDLTTTNVNVSPLSPLPKISTTSTSTTTTTTTTTTPITTNKPLNIKGFSSFKVTLPKRPPQKK